MVSMAFRTVAMPLMLSLFLISRAVMGNEGEYSWGEGGKEGSDARPFIMERSEEVMKTDGGEVRVVRGHRWNGDRPKHLHIGFISMEPNTLFIPQYLDSNLILFVRRGEVKIGWIHKDRLVEKRLKTGDVNRIPAGSAFYMVNTGKGQRLQIICSIDSDIDGDWWGPPFRSFFIGGGVNPKSVLTGFDMGTLTTAFNASVEEVEAITKGPAAGPIIYVSGEAADQTRLLASVMQAEINEEEEEEEENKEWTWRKLLHSVLGDRPKVNKKSSGQVSAPDSYNLYDSEPGFKNRYGWSTAIDKHDYSPLGKSDIGVYMVNLTAGSMMAPHVNPLATEYGVVLSGSGDFQVVFPNGTAAMHAEVREGDVFFIPRYFPFCQIASRGGPLHFFGFTTSARNNRPQFLVGGSSILRTMMGPELAAGMGVSEDALEKLVKKQREDVILPSWPVQEEWEKGREDMMGRIKRVVDAY